MLCILAGGSDSLYPKYGVQLANLIHNEIENPVILSCSFSQPDDIAIKKYDEYTAWFKVHFPGSTIIRAIKSDFFQQIESSDVIYLHGGQTTLLLDALPDFDHFKAATRQKIVVGSSAGANYLSSVCYSPSAGMVVKTTGIVPVGVVVHYGIKSFNFKNYSMAQWHRAADTVQKEADGLPVLLLPEGTFSSIVV